MRPVAVYHNEFAAKRSPSDGQTPELTFLLSPCVATVKELRVRIYDSALLWSPHLSVASGAIFFLLPDARLLLLTSAELLVSRCGERPLRVECLVPRQILQLDLVCTFL